ncbi:NANOG neighbor homeobox [Equus przewalskii]|uniref:NANOG neighbor homeobox n=1 Tax=Equus przewalskii TaxID=9798 RepID=A0ABM4PAS8_EQUPR
MDLYQQGLEAGDNFTKSKSWSTPSSQNNWIGLKCNINPLLEDGINGIDGIDGMSFEETLSSALQFLAQDEQYMNHLQHLQDTKTCDKAFLNSSDATRSADLATQKQLPKPRDQNSDQSNRNHSEGERSGEKKWKEREKEEEKEDEIEEKQEEDQNERLVSKPLMDALWATFKMNRCPTIGDKLSLAFEFNMTEKQIDQWFCKKRKKYNKEMKKQKYKKRLKSCFILSFYSFEAT